MIRFLFDALQFYNELNGKKKQSDLKKKMGALAALYAVISLIVYSFLNTRIDHTMAVMLSGYVFLIGELIIGVLFFKKFKSTAQPTLLQSAQLIKNLIPQSFSSKQKVALVGASLLVLLILLPKSLVRGKS